MSRLPVALNLAVLCIPALALAQGAATQPAVEPFLLTPQSQPGSEILKTDMDRASYSVGLDIAKNIRRQIPDADLDLLIKGIRDGMSEQSLLTEWQTERALRVFGEMIQARQEEKKTDPDATNKRDGEIFLARNAKQPGVKVTPSGLQYRIIKEGDGPSPTIDDVVRVRYRGTLVDGTEFDSSRGHTASFAVKGVIPGWTEALQMMKVNARWQLFIPPKLAYGNQQAGPAIGPNSTLIFEIDLVGIKNSQPGAPSQRAGDRTTTIEDTGSGQAVRQSSFLGAHRCHGRVVCSHAWPSDAKEPKKVA